MTKGLHTIRIGWLYPRLMSTYGDRGNILVLKLRTKLRGISLTVVPLDEDAPPSLFKSVDAFFGGGAQDLEQGIVMADLKGKKQHIMLEKIDSSTPALFVCGAPQLMGKWYEPGVGKRINGIGIFDMTTKHPGESSSRLIGNVVAEISNHSLLNSSDSDTDKKFLVGFENHGGRTTLGKSAEPLARVLYGNGNNGNDKTEGVVFKNAIGTYLHGPLLPKNPFIADWLIKKTLEIKYNSEFILQPLEDTVEHTAQRAVAKRLGIAL